MSEKYVRKSSLIAHNKIYNMSFMKLNLPFEIQKGGAYA